MVEQIIEDYRRAYHINYCILRYFNAAGADEEGELGEWHDPETHLIPLVLKAALNGNKVSIYGNDYPTKDGTCVRDYIHIDDLADAHILALEYIQRKNTSNSFNLANGQGYSVREIINVSRMVTGKSIRTEIKERRSGDPAVLIGNPRKAELFLGWKPKYDLRHIIETAWKWEQKLY